MEDDVELQCSISVLYKFNQSVANQTFTLNVVCPQQMVSIDLKWKEVKQILPMYAIHRTHYNGHSPVQLSRFIKTGLSGGSVNSPQDVDTKPK